MEEQRLVGVDLPFWKQVLELHDTLHGLLFSSTHWQ